MSQATHRRRWPVVAAGLVVTAAVVTAWLLLMPSPADGEAVVGVTQVEVRDDAFTPPVIEVTAGTTVTWTFAGDEPHNLVGEGWGVEAPTTSGTVAQTFEDPGTYRYRCTLHLNMDGRVDVVPSTSGTTS